MDEQRQIAIDAFEIDGQRLCFQQGLIIIDEAGPQGPRWHAVFLHPHLEDASPDPVVASVHAHGVAGEQISGRIWRGSFVNGAEELHALLPGRDCVLATDRGGRCQLVLSSLSGQRQYYRAVVRQMPLGGGFTYLAGLLAVMEP